MKTTLIATAAAGALAILAGAAVAQSSAGPSAAGEHASRGLGADADGDGRISRAEFVDGRVARLTAMDADRDGSVSAEEMRAAAEARRSQRVSARFETLDRNGDGALSREEFTAGHESRAGRGGPGHPPGMGGHGGHGGHAGHGGDKGDRAEARGPVSIAEVQTRVAAQFDRLDADRDGYVTVEERRAQHDAMREHRRDRRAAGQTSPSGPASE